MLSYNYKFENNNQNVCCHYEQWEILGTGVFDKVGYGNGHYCNLYYCPLCKKVYYEDCHFRTDVIKVFYSKKATCYYLKELNINLI